LKQGNKARVFMQEQVFLLRRWRDSEEEGWKWSLKDIKEGKVEFFVSEKRLLEYLKSIKYKTANLKKENIFSSKEKT
jgi:hypothetical protein